MQRPFHLNIVGEKNSGKTTLILSLISELRALGLNTGTVKHTSHEHEFDLKGTDSWKHQQAESKTTVILSPSKMVCHVNDPTIEDIEKTIEAVFRNYDIVLWEGDKNTTHDIIECVLNDDEPHFAADDRFVAFVSGKTSNGSSNQFSICEANSLAKWICDRYGLLKDQNIHKDRLDSYE